MLARKFWESTLHTVTWTGFHTLNFPVTDTYAKLFNLQAELFLADGSIRLLDHKLYN